MRRPPLLLALLPLLAPPALAQSAQPTPPPVHVAPPPAAAQVNLADLLHRLAYNTPDSEELLEERLSSFTMTSFTEELDGKGRVKHNKLRVTRVHHEGERRVAQLVHAEDDGQDTTEKTRAELEKRGQAEDQKKNEKGLSFPVPFIARSQPLHHFTLVGPDKNDPTKVVVHFEPADRKGTDVMVGDAVVDPQTAMLQWLRLRPTKYQSSLVDRIDVEMRFRVEPGVGAVVQRIVGEGDGGLLFVRRHRRSTVTFTDVVFKPARASEGTP
ncbi:hypothetical protein FGE12_05785 [Aggregicoccus sp. 17bor-14]|uniref:hypothetical protein n=1 Tax=Myxococcaceae TaxID=31 RepID=UPI00129CB0F0|nr:MULTISPECIES: hypothetical protein [Myxococcaceae]MBF5041894.1 hypothetical protein [Simulacricoccus sp. 17bor-14]MRI87675.1 hypothetical protein [Aggregicoccus sp. 17bor-14]